MAWSTRKSVGLQRDQLEAVKEQLRLSREQWDATKRAAQPMLDVDVTSIDEQGPNAFCTVHYHYGTEPAFDVVVWIKLNTATLTATVPIVVPVMQEKPVFLNQFPSDPASVPFPEFNKPPHLERNECWVGLTWRTAAGAQHQTRYRRAANGDLDYDPEVMEPYDRSEDLYPRAPTA